MEPTLPLACVSDLAPVGVVGDGRVASHVHQCFRLLDTLATVAGEAWFAKTGPDLATLMSTANDWKQPFLAHGWTP